PSPAATGSTTAPAAARGAARAPTTGPSPTSPPSRCPCPPGGRPASGARPPPSAPPPRRRFPTPPSAPSPARTGAAAARTCRGRWDQETTMSHIQPVFDGMHLEAPAPAKSRRIVDDYEAWVDEVTPHYVAAADTGQPFTIDEISRKHQLPDPPSPKSQWGGLPA